MRKYLIWALTSLSMMFVSLAYAATDEALVLVKEVVTEMTDALDKQLPAIKKDPNLIVGIVDKIVVPHVNFNIMSKSVLARHWRTATATQRAEFEKVFSRWVVLTYSAAFLHYNGQKVEFTKTRPIGNKGDREEVFTFIVQNNGQKIPVNYRLVKGTTDWQAYDFNVENVSLVTSFRTQIDSEINRKGIDAVIKDLAARNAKGIVPK